MNLKSGGGDLDTVLPGLGKSIRQRLFLLRACRDLMILRSEL